MNRSKTLPILAALVTGSLAALTASAADAPSSMRMPGMKMPASAGPAAKVGQTTGKVIAIDASRSRITIAHHRVAALGWPAMTMTFQATPRQLRGIQPGEQVAFAFSVHGGAAVIQRIGKIG